MLHIRLPCDRNRVGELKLVDSGGRKICGPFPVAARASDALAAAHGNPGRDPFLRYGDTPTGEYVLRRILPSGKQTRFSKAEFGPYGLVVLEGIAGDAALAEANGRFHFVISGGDLSREGTLRSTAGWLRLANKDMRTLLGVLKKVGGVRCQIVEDTSLKPRARVYVDSRCREKDPLELPAVRTTTVLGREAFLGGAAGAVMLELSVAFFAASPREARADAPAIHDSRPQQEVRFALPAAAPAHHYVRMAYGTDTKAMDQLKALDKTGAQYNQQGVDTPNTSPPPVVAPSTTTAPTDPMLQKQQEINAIRSEKPPPNATSDQLKQWQQNQDQKVQQILNSH